MCEGSRDEFTYVKKARSSIRLSKENLQIEAAHGGSPQAVVEYAVERASAIGFGTREEELDEAWVVFDAELAPQSGAGEAVAAALSAGLSVAISNPCFELWLLLHARRENAYLTAAEAKRRCDTELCIPGPQNRPPDFDDPRLGGTWETAAEHALESRLRIIGDESLSEPANSTVVLARNPATNVDDLLRSILCARPGPQQ